MSPETRPTEDCARLLEELIRPRLAQAALAGHRGAFLLSGTRPWCHRLAARVHDALRMDSCWIGHGAPAQVRALGAARARRLLGRELELLVFDAWSGFDPDAFGAAMGTVRGGGLVLLLAPALHAWPSFADPDRLRLAAGNAVERVGGRFLERLAGILAADPAITLLAEGRPWPPATLAATPARAPASCPAPYRSADQQRAVEAILGLARRDRGALVLRSDRGRGKSAALGIAAARLLDEDDGRIIIAAPRRQAVEAVFERAAALLPGARLEANRLRRENGWLSFVPPGELVLDPQPADLLLVDEAAAIPAPLLARLLGAYPRVAFATTVHGYEGTGRGFALRFHHVLDRQAPGWLEQVLRTPVRWADGDPLEGLCFRVLLLDAAPAAAAHLLAREDRETEPQELDRDALAHDEATLRELFGLLVQAHYRTTPFDLRYLLDGPDVRVFVLRRRGHVAAAALIDHEGGFEPRLARAIWTGARRPRGHLVAQSLAFHAGFEEAARLRGARVLRIAVHPAIQRQGVGSRLLAFLAERVAEEGRQYLSASFGAEPGLLDFWQRAGAEPVRLGLRREASSGYRSVIVLRALDAESGALARRLRSRLHESLPALRAEPLADLDPELAIRLGAAASTSTALGEQDWRDLVGFVLGLRPYECTLAALRKFAARTLATEDELGALGAAQRLLLERKVVEGKDWAEVDAELGCGGRGPTLAALRRALRAPLLAALPGELAGLARDTEDLCRAARGPGRNV